MTTFRRAELIRFQHCDPAGIVFYPRYIEMINATVEDWFEHIGISFADIHGPMDAAIPIVSLEVDFRSPTRLGERIELELDVERIGRTSITLRVRAALLDETKFISKLVLVYISKTDHRPHPWPDVILDGVELGR